MIIYKIQYNQFGIINLKHHISNLKISNLLSVLAYKICESKTYMHTSMFKCTLETNYYDEKPFYPIYVNVCPLIHNMQNISVCVSQVTHHICVVP